MLCEMLSVSSRIWTRVAVSISYNDNHYTTGIYIYIYIYIYNIIPRKTISWYHKSLVVLCFDLLTRPKMPFKVMHRKEVTHSGGSYERKSRRRKLADEMGRDKKRSHYTLIDWRAGREWPLNWMTVISVRWRSHRPFQRKRKWHIPVPRYRK